MLVPGDTPLMTLLVWECRSCPATLLRRVDVYDPHDPDPECCPDCGEPWEPYRTPVSVKPVADR